MSIYSPKLFIEINNSEYIFVVGDKRDNEDFKLIYKCFVPIQGIKNNKIIDYNLVYSTIKKNIYIIEEKLNFTFKETVLIINNFNCSFVNLTGFKKLNGSQILKENITYILNSLKSYIDETDNTKTILHIFNSKYMLEKKKIENLPIGLFGDFYSHELSFCLIENNDYKNLNNIFKSCNLKIKKIILKSLIEGSLISNGNPNLDTFFQIKINKDNSQLFYFENDSLKFEQKFDFGSDLVINDISKITSLKIETIKKILGNIKLQKKISDDVVVKKELFDNENYIKVKEKLIFDIAKARIQELSEVMVSKNINLLSLNKKESIFFLKINDQLHSRCFENEYLYYFSNNKNFKVRTLKSNTTEGIIRGANKIVNFGWKKEAIPVAHMKKSIIAKFFDILFS
jgi:cell division protein FtsA